MAGLMSDILEKEKICQRLNHAIDLVLFNQIDSTNHYLMQLAQGGCSTHTACIAEQQTQGKGRSGKPWFSPHGQNIYLSILWNFDLTLSQLSGLSLAIGIAVIKALQDCGIQEGLKIKWPNDILFEEKKLAGILVETLINQNRCQVIIGIGLNVRMNLKTATIDQPWASLATIEPLKQFDRNIIAAELLNQIIETIETFSKSMLNPFLEIWKQHDVLFNQKVNLKHGQQTLQGTAKGITSKGELLLMTLEKKILTLSSAEAINIRSLKNI